MSAVKLIFKRSSLLGKRPTNANLEAGEIGLNTNSTEPGLFFEVNDGNVVKVGPTAYLPEVPTQIPARGELWVDSDTKAMSIGTELGEWQKVAAPYLGGTNGLTVFVAPEFPNATDSLANDGQTVPFVTINRAILEVTKNIIQTTLSGISLGNNRYQIILAPGQHCIVNTPGVSPSNFAVDLSNPYTQVTQDILRRFNPENVGGLVLPRGVSILGLDLKKCELHPIYVPKYSHPAFPPAYQQAPGGPLYINQPRSSILRWSGNTYVSNFTGLDKIEYRLVTQVAAQEGTGYALFKSERPHGLGFNDFVRVDYSNSADQVGSTFAEGAYYAYPVTSFEFMLSPYNWEGPEVAPVPAAALPASYFTTTPNRAPKFQVADIYPYFIPEDGETYELSSYSHHRLSLLANASVQQLNNYYTKVQKAFPNLFGGQVNANLTSTPETEIVSSTSGVYPTNLATNSTDNSSPYQNMVNHRSDYGMSNGDYDGDIVSGFKSVIVNSSTAVILQKDPVAYEIYSTSTQDWTLLTQLAQQSLGGNVPVTSVSREVQLQLLNEASIPNIRYYYTNLTVVDPDSGDNKSIGLPDPDNDFRHFGFRISGANSYMQAQAVYSIGAAIACWSRRGAIMSLTNATTNFGSVAFQAEGFAGIGTLGGANAINKGFLQTGIVRPLQLLEDAVISDEQKRILYLGSKMVYVAKDPNSPDVQLVYLQRSFDPASILPFSLKPGSALFTSDGVCSFRGFFVTDGSPTCILSGDATQNPYSPGGAILRLRAPDSTLPEGPVGSLDIPFIRRFIDPRTPAEKSYGFFVQSTNPTSQAPQLGSALRLNQTGQSLSNTIKRNYQFDPGQYGGVSQVFTVDLVETDQYSSSANFNYKVADASQSTNYVVYASLTDASSPWIQSVPSVTDGYEAFYNPQGTYITYDNKNYYAAENNLWSALYYQTNFNPLNGPTKVTPDKADSPFVLTSVLEKNELIVDSWQGYVPDPLYSYYTEGAPDGIPAPYNANLSYMRGAVVPYTEFAPQYQVDNDDGSIDMGIIFKRIAVDANSTVVVADTFTVQTAEDMTSPYALNPSFGRPEIIQLELLSVSQLVSPREGVSIVQLTNPALNAVEYVRVVYLNSNIIQAQRNYYPQYAQGTLPAQWPQGSVAKACVSSGFPEPSVYDPDWAITKVAMFRFFQLMGYEPGLIDPYLTPQYSGERIFTNAELPLAPVNGYANLTTPWPIEFNNPSTIIANTHTWQYVGYLDYSRGLPKYQVNEISKKLSYDFLSTTTWGGRLTVMGANETGQLVFLGPVKEALTGQFYEYSTPLSYAANRQIYRTPDPVDVPNPVLVFSVDDISGQFDGNVTGFNLTRGGFSIPVTQLSSNGLIVNLGGVIQKPGEAYIIQGEGTINQTARIGFTEPPPAGTSCDIRVITSEDEGESVVVETFTLSPAFDGSTSSFIVTPSDEALTNLNSFMFLSGVEQNPTGPFLTSAAYNIQTIGGVTSLDFIGGSPLPGTTSDLRAILAGNRYRVGGVSTVFVSSVDDIAPTFNGVKSTFPLEIQNVPLDPNKVNAQNIFVSLGGVMQIPVNQAGNPQAGLVYSVALNPVTKVLEITFTTPPLTGTTCNIRIITSEEFLTCPLPESLTSTTLKDGPGVKVNAKNQIIEIDSGLIG